MSNDSAYTWSAEIGDVQCDSRSLAGVLSRFVPLSVVGPDAIEQSSESVRLLPLDDLVFCDFAWGPREISRDTSGTYGGSDGYVVLAAIHAGTEVVVTDGGRFVLTPGDVAFWDCQAAMSTQVMNFLRKSALLIPTRLLVHKSPRSPGYKAFECFTDAPIASLLSRLLASLGDSADPAALIHRRMRNALLQAALATIEESSANVAGAMSDLPTAVCFWLDDHLFDPDLDSRRIAAAHFVSVRTLHRAFENYSQTLGQTIRVRKLERARDLLADPQQTVGAISERLNFASPSHFSRLFVEHYGSSPSDYRAELMNSFCEQLSDRGD